MFSGSNTYSAPPFWHNGPAPGNFYNFPNLNSTQNTDFKQHTQTPVTTGSSIVALTFDKGVVIAGDTLASYGSLARYRNCPRVFKVNDNIILGAGGDYGDFQYVKDLIDQLVVHEQCLDDGYTMKPKSLQCWLTRVMYNRRSKFDPFWNNFVVGGLQEGEPYLATVDKLGTAYEDEIICTGFGAHLATPILREAYEANPKPSEKDAKALIDKAMEVLFYRDARSYPKYTMATVTEAGITVEGPFEVKHSWNLAFYAKSK